MPRAREFKDAVPVEGAADAADSEEILVAAEVETSPTTAAGEEEGEDRNGEAGEQEKQEKEEQEQEHDHKERAVSRTMPPSPSRNLAGRVTPSPTMAELPFRLLSDGGSGNAPDGGDGSSPTSMPGPW